MVLVSMCTMWNEPTPPSGFPRSLMSYIQWATYLGNPLGGVSASDMIDIGLMPNFIKKTVMVSIREGSDRSGFGSRFLPR